MDIRPEIALLVLGCALVTALPRVLPLVLLSRFELPALLRQWLGYVPVAVLAALLALELLAGGGNAALAIVPALAVAALSGNLLATVAVGVAAYGLLPQLF